MPQRPILLDAINERELDIIRLLAKGLSNKEIADQLFLSVNTIKWYITQLNSKLGTKNRHEITEQARSLELLQEPIPAARTNLPHPTTAFVGRETQIAELTRIFEASDARLVTILAPGGMGKTRLALKFLEQQIPHYHDGVYFIPLQHIQEPQEIVFAIGEHTPFFFHEEVRDPRQQVLDYLSNKHMLLMLDNFEHLLGNHATLLNDLLQAAPNLRLLVTSREKLSLLSETILMLEGMSFPDSTQQKSTSEYDAIELLVQAGQRIKPQWQLTEANLPDAIRLCTLTQGMPLGILLAMSWFDVYDLQRICREVGTSIDFLQTDLHDIPERQRSIKHIFEISWQRLSPKERQVWQQLSVFRGGFTHDAAEKVADASGQVLKNLASRALVVVDEHRRCDIHELLRQYSEEKLAEDGQTLPAHQNHLTYFADLLATLAPKLKAHGQIDALQTMQIEFKNIQAAWHRALNTQNRAEIIRLMESLTIFLDVTTRFDDLSEVLDEAENVLGGTEAQHEKDELARILLWRGELYEHHEQHEKARKQYEHAVALLQGSQNQHYRALAMLQISTYVEGVTERLYVIDRALAIFREIDSQWGSVKALDSKAYLAFSQGHFDKGIAYTEECAVLYREMGDLLSLSWAINHLGIFAMRQGRWEDAHAYFLESLSLAYTLQSPLRILTNHINIAQLALQRKAHYVEAGQHLHEAIELARTYNLQRFLTTGLQLLSELATAAQD